MPCIACGKQLPPAMTWMAEDAFSHDRTYAIEFCPCGLGRTILGDDAAGAARAVQASYDQLEQRVHLYYRTAHNHLTVRYLQALRIIGRFEPGKRLLEVGSNIGFTLSIAGRAGYSVRGCETNARSRHFASLVYGFDCAPDLFELDGEVDVVVMNDVLEHFQDPGAALRKARSLLANDGIVFVQLPNAASAQAKACQGRWKYLLPPDHLYHFSAGALDALAERCALEPVWKRTVSGVEDVAWLAWLPARVRSVLVRLLNQNPLYWPGLYERRRGVLLQAIYRKNE